MNGKSVFGVCCLLTLLSTALCYVRIGSSQNPHYIILTFDDSKLQRPGDETVAIMDSYGYKGVAFITVDWTRPTLPVWTHVIQKGWEIGDHTWTHPDLNNVSASQLKHEVSDSKAWIEQQFSSKVISFSYPGSAGSDNATVLQALKDAGYLYARESTWHKHWDGQRSLQVVSHCLMHGGPGYENNYVSGVQAAINDTMQYGIAALMFHAVSNTSQNDPYGLLPSEFRYCLDQVKNAGLQPVTFKEWDQIKYGSPVQWKLTVASAYGSPSPGVGDNLCNDGSSVTCRVTSPVTVDDVSYNCTGWTGTGSVPSSGSNTSVTFTITQNSTITWNWVVLPQYGLLVGVSGSGTTNATGAFMYGASTVVAVNATPASGWSLNGWLLNGTSAGSANPYVVTMVQNTNLTAVFVQLPPQAESLIFFNFVSNPATPSSSVTLKGLLVNGSGDAIGNASVTVEYSTNDGKSWNYIWTLTTNKNGTFYNTFSAPGVGRFLVRVSYAGSSTQMPSSNNAYLKVLSTALGGTAAGSVFFNFNPNRSTPNTNATLRGILLDESGKATVSAAVTVDYSMDNGSTWIQIWTLTTDQYGMFSNTFKAPEGTYLARATSGSSTIATYLLVFT